MAFEFAVRFKAVEHADRKRLRHVHQHGAGAHAPLAVAAAVVEAHAGAGVFHRRQLLAFEQAIPAGLHPEQAGLHRAQPAAGLARRDAAHHFRGRPVIDAAAGGLPAIQLARRDVDPVQRLLRCQPDRAFADGVAGIENQFRFHGGQGVSNGPDLTKAPPW